MRLRQSRVLFLALGTILATACSTSLKSFHCETSSECTAEGKVGGVCEAEKVCSFADPSCGDEDGQRYSDLAGPLSNECVNGGPDSDAMVTIESDAQVEVADANPAAPDAEPSDSGPDAMIPGCVNLVLTVADDESADDFVRVRTNGLTALECDPVSPGNNQESFAMCVYCMPLGADIEIKAVRGAHLQTSITTCGVDCSGNDNCNFIATTTCQGLYEFDVQTPTPP